MRRRGGVSSGSGFGVVRFSSTEVERLAEGGEDCLVNSRNRREGILRDAMLSARRIAFCGVPAGEGIKTRRNRGRKGIVGILICDSFFPILPICLPWACRPIFACVKISRHVVPAGNERWRLGPTSNRRRDRPPPQVMCADAGIISTRLPESFLVSVTCLVSAFSKFA